jgi:hypothetical protein
MVGAARRLNAVVFGIDYGQSNDLNIGLIVQEDQAVPAREGFLPVNHRAFGGVVSKGDITTSSTAGHDTQPLSILSCENLNGIAGRNDVCRLLDRAVCLTITSGAISLSQAVISRGAITRQIRVGE